LPIEAFARSPALRQHKLVIVGEGPEREAMERRIAEENLGGCVQLLGRRPQAEVGELMRKSDVFVFPSIRELGAGVVAEAMASGMCCVTPDYGGPAELLANGRGVKVPMGPPAELTQNFTLALERLAASPAEIQACRSSRLLPWRSAALREAQPPPRVLTSTRNRRSGRRGRPKRGLPYGNGSVAPVAR
jgi:glycosyltransferase involved in cell wall biosynthesis